MSMNYIDDIAERIYRVNDPAGEISADDLALYRIYAVLCLAKGGETTCRDVHDAWSAWTAERRPAHGSLVPFHRLRSEVQALDQPYVDAIHAAARQIRDAPAPVRMLIARTNPRAVPARGDPEQAITYDGTHSERTMDHGD